MRVILVQHRRIACLCSLILRPPPPGGGGGTSKQQKKQQGPFCGGGVGLGVERGPASGQALTWPIRGAVRAPGSSEYAEEIRQGNLGVNVKEMKMLSREL